jgi:hypothetical protein
LGYPNNNQTYQNYESSRTSLCKPQISQYGCLIFCVCCPCKDVGIFFFPTDHQIRTSYSFCFLFFTTFFISLSILFYIFLYTFSSHSHLSYLWLCFTVPCLLLCLFLRFFTYYFSTVCIYVSFFVIYLLIYLPGDTEKHNGKMHPKIRPFTHSLAKVVQYSRMLNIFHATSNLFLQPNWNFEICRYQVYLCNQL